MKSIVFFIPAQLTEPVAATQAKLDRLCTSSRLFDGVVPKSSVIIKIHYGEEGNTGFVRPEFLRPLCRRLQESGATVKLSDSNTLYRGRRVECAGHLELAHEHGFTDENTGAVVSVVDESLPEEILSVPVKGKYIQVAKIPRVYMQADLLIGIAHFKGHILAGFGGALKNIGMGCASREGKLAQHSDISPFVHRQSCVGCAACVAVCPVDAISLEGNKALIDATVCIGCASCIAACDNGAMDVNWGAGSATMVDKMIEYASAVLKGRKRIAFVNFATKITAECDCLAKDDPRIAPDVGILASADPVALDQASLDLVIQKANGRDVFREAHPAFDGRKQLAHAEKLGLGSREYELIRL
jgi:uncharacterized Fe-S center protein